MHKGTLAQTHTCSLTHIFARARKHAYTHSLTNTYTHIHTHTHTHTHTHRTTHTHTRTRTRTRTHVQIFLGHRDEAIAVLCRTVWPSSGNTAAITNVTEHLADNRVEGGVRHAAAVVMMSVLVVVVLL